MARADHADNSALTAEVEALSAHFAAHNDRWTDEHLALVTIAAPPYGEGPRAEALVKRLVELGLDAVGRDAAGNVLARCCGDAAGGGPRLVVAAHLDTVFGPEVALEVRREGLDGRLLRCPGIGDDTAGLVMLPALAEALLARRVSLPGELWLVATVGEESVGNLRGARHLAGHGLPTGPVDAFITLDAGTAGQIIRHGTHSRNHHLTLRGPGGHAWGDFGAVNPNVTLARIVARVGELDVPERPRTIHHCGLMHGGQAPNALPEVATGHLNLRSESAEVLRQLSDHVDAIITEAVAWTNARRRKGAELALEHEISGRDGGETPAEAPLVRAAVATAERRRLDITHPCSSTDANAFMAAGIDAICVYRGDGGGEHTLEEWYDAATRPLALSLVAETVLRYFDQAEPA